MEGPIKLVLESIEMLNRFWLNMTSSEQSKEAQSGPIKCCLRRNHMGCGNVRKKLEIGWVETGSKNAQNQQLIRVRSKLG